MGSRILLLLLTVTTVLSAEFQYSVKNTLKYGKGSEWAGETKDIELPKHYIEDYLDLELTKNNFTLGLRFEAADSSEHNEKIRDITKRYFRYTGENATLTAGDFYSTFDRGVVLDLREEKADFFDNYLSGGKFELTGDFYNITALGGKGYFKYENDFNPLEKKVDQFDNFVIGSNGSFSLSDYFEWEEFGLTLGSSYLFMKGDYVNSTQYLYDEMFIRESEIGAVSIDAFYGDFSFYNEYAIKTTQRTPSVRGWANYSSLAYAIKGFSVNLEYKDYYKYGANPNEVASNFSIYQNAPEALVVHDSHLMGTNPHTVSANDEIGYKIDLKYKPLQNLNITNQFAFGSRHDGNSILPNLDDEFLPYYDEWFSIQYKLQKIDLKIGAGLSKDTPLSKHSNMLVTEESQSVNGIYSEERNTYLGSVHYKINPESELKGSSEVQFVSAKDNYTDEDYEDFYYSLEYALPEYGYVSISYTKTTEEVIGDAPDNWLGFEAGLKLYKNHNLEIFYGRERAGMKCSGGACRQVPEFDGLKVTLTSSF